MEDRTIVYPTDFSACSENAMPYVIAIAKATMAKVKIIHSLELMGVYSTGVTGADTSMLIQTMEESSNKILARIKESFDKESIPCETELVME